MRITREALILREIISLLESLKPPQRERCLGKILSAFPPVWARGGPATLTGMQQAGVPPGVLGGAGTIPETKEVSS